MQGKILQRKINAYFEFNVTYFAILILIKQDFVVQNMKLIKSGFGFERGF